MGIFGKNIENIDNYGKNIETIDNYGKNVDGLRGATAWCDCDPPEQVIIIISAEIGLLTPLLFRQTNPRKNKPSDQKDAQRGVIKFCPSLVRDFLFLIWYMAAAPKPQSGHFSVF